MPPCNDLVRNEREREAREGDAKSPPKPYERQCISWRVQTVRDR